ncbi:GIY-YIG nuclease family protein [Streptomyces sp. SS07]|uniref:GIY-YIG nuclease family protein n=1 Tax=Streptomyces sp. SS07 TaxID=2015315 RepID=UPI000B5C6A16|nr:GIY-YIG nuclease family protein [Streptomyces sp. SS07]
MAQGRPFIPAHELQKREQDRIRLPFRHLVDPQDPYYYDISLYLEMQRRAGVEIDQAIADNAVKFIHWKHQNVKDGEAKRREFEAKQAKEAKQEIEAWKARKEAAERWKTSDGIVYYILRGPLIKIGTTTRPRSRFDTLMPDAVLAIEPGGKDLERLRHTEFASLRDPNVGREYFTPGSDLLDLIRQLREEGGVPHIPHASLISREAAELAVKELLAL